ncbi:MAG: hypothetical protein EXX96DRAFT_576984 [Benjaminiella poitrasii]|nr:MAG: hypothetical protein EXX96DRAFT_576984 [Benjaminiella poitrasii]
MSNHNELIEQFVGMTGAPKQQAEFYLELSNWDIQMAVSQFFDNNGSDVPEQIPVSNPTTTSSTGPFMGSSNSSGASTPTKRKAAGSDVSKIRTLSDLNSMIESMDSGDDEHENLYAGGEKSGMVVQGPNKRSGGSSGNNDLVDEILKKAAEGGAAPEEPASAPKKPTFYTGAGYRLGSEDEPSSVVEPAASSTAGGSNLDEEPETVTRHLTFWRNGFSVDDGPLYEYTDPANQEMLTAINSGRAPLSLLNVRHGQPVEVRVVKKQDEDYTPPPKSPPKPFQGVGNRLGSPASFAASPSSSSTPGAFPVTNDSNNGVAPTVDQNQPTTNIQIRLGDGSKLVAKLNHTHTIADIRQYIEANQSTASRPYILQTTFPVKVLSDDTQTVKEAGLLNSVIVQRYQ